MPRSLAILAVFTILLSFSAAVYSDEKTPIPFDPYHVPGVYWPGLAPYLKPGSGKIEGRLVARTQLFGEVAFPNTRVDLLPSKEITEWILRSSAYNLEHDDYKKHDPMPTFPSQLGPYEKTTMTDDHGYFRFSNLPDGDYYVYSTPRRVDFRHPTRYTTEEQIAADGESVTILEKTEGLKELSDIVVIAASATVDTKENKGSDLVDRFDVLGESTCCKAEI
jgi:hypothetical protein